MGVSSWPAQCLFLKSIRSEHHCDSSGAWASTPHTDSRLQLTPSNTSSPGMLPTCKTFNSWVVPPFHCPSPTMFHFLLCPAQILQSVMIITLLATPLAAIMLLPFSTFSWLSHRPGRSNISTYPTWAPRQRNEAGESTRPG